MVIIKRVSKKHALGNMISGLCKIADGLILFLSLGHVDIGATIRFTIYRRSTGFLCDIKIDRSENNKR